MHEFFELGESMTDSYVVTLAKGGYNVRYGKKQFEYAIRKEGEGRRVWADMTAEEQEARKNEALVVCECNVCAMCRGSGKRTMTDKELEAQVENKDSTVPCECDKKMLADPDCVMCKGEGRRMMTTKEREALEWKLRQWADQDRREHCGDGNWAEYVMRSTDKMAKEGVWHDPYETDGYHLGKWKVKTPLPTRVIRHEVKVFHKDVLVGIVEKEVKVSIDKNRIKEKWKSLWNVLLERQDELVAESEVFIDPFLVDRIKKKISLLNAIQNVLAKHGNCTKGKTMVESVLRHEQFDMVAHLWAEESAKEAAKAVTEASESEEEVAQSIAQNS